MWSSRKTTLNFDRNPDPVNPVSVPVGEPHSQMRTNFYKFNFSSVLINFFLQFIQEGGHQETKQKSHICGLQEGNGGQKDAETERSKRTLQSG